MHIEHSLAARKLTELLAAGHTRESAITLAAEHLAAQGFDAAHSRCVAEKMADHV